MKKSKLNLNIRPRGLRPEDCQTKLIPGAGAKDYKFPADLANAAIKRLGRVKDINKPPAILPGETNILGLGGKGLWDLLRPVAAPVGQDHDYEALVLGAGHIQELIMGAQLGDIYEQMFAELENGVAAGKKLPAKFQPAVSDHEKQVKTLRAQVEEALPVALKKTAEANPDAPMHAVLQHVVAAIMEELAPIIGILNVYGMAFIQNTNGRFAEQLTVVNEFMETCFFLWQTGDLDAMLSGKPVTPQLDTSTFQVGDILLTCVGGNGLGTIPGSTGPIGLHLLMVPLDMLSWLPQALALLAHESRHQVFHDVKGLEAAIQKAVDSLLRAAYKDKRLKLTTEKMKLGRFVAPTIDVLCKLLAGDCIGEIDADVGGISLMGPAFHTSMLLSFPAMLIRNGKLKDAKQLLRTGSVFNLVPQANGKTALEFEVHPPDYVRVYIAAAMYDNLGMKEDAKMMRRLADFCVGKVPEFITWTDAEGKSSIVVKIATADIIAAAPFVAEAILRTKLPEQGGKCTTDLALWTAARQAKVVELARSQLAGSSALPAAGSIFATYLGAAAATAYSDSNTAGEEPAAAMVRINDAFYRMSAALRARNKAV